MSIRHKLLFLFCLITLVLGGALAYLYASQQQALRQIGRNETQARLLLVNQIIALHGESTRNMVNDYTFWDDMVDFVEDPDQGWADENLNPAFVTFGLDYIWVFTPTLEPVYAGSRDGLRQTTLPITIKNFIHPFKDGHFPRFIVRSPQGLLECFAASIHPTSDNRRETTPRGYMVVARSLNDNLLQELSQLTFTELTLYRPNDGNPRPLTRIDASGKLELYIPLEDLSGEIQAWIKAEARSNHVNAYHTSAKELMAAMTTGVLFSLIMLYWYLHSWVQKPLRIITRALENDCPEELRKLGQQNTEFENVAILIEAFFEQRHELQEEVQHHQLARKALEASDAKFNQIFSHIPVGLIALDHNLHIRLANHAALKLFGYKLHELEGEHLSMLLHPDDLDACITSLMALSRGEKAFHRGAQRYLSAHAEIIAASQTDICIQAEDDCLYLVCMIEPV